MDVETNQFSTRIAKQRIVDSMSNSPITKSPDQLLLSKSQPKFFSVINWWEKLLESGGIFIASSYTDK